VRSIDIYLSVHSPEAMMFKDEFMTFWNYQRKECITDMSMSLSSHPFLPPAGNGSKDAVTKISFPEKI